MDVAVPGNWSPGSCTSQLRSSPCEDLPSSGDSPQAQPACETWFHDETLEQFRPSVGLPFTAQYFIESSDEGFLVGRDPDRCTCSVRKKLCVSERADVLCATVSVHDLWGCDRTVQNVIAVPV